MSIRNLKRKVLLNALQDSGNKKFIKMIKKGKIRIKPRDLK